MTDISSISGGTGKASSSLVNFSKDFDSFLLLLTQQLKNQDPLKPMDATEFTSQLVQFTGVEQSIQQNKNLESLIALQGDVQTSAATAYLGKTVDLDGNSAQLSNGTANINYSLSTAAAKVVLEISDSAGTVVRKVEVDHTSGQHVYTWDGRSDLGRQLTDGTYTVKMTGTNSSGESVAVKTQAFGVVSNVGYVGGQVVLTVGNTRVPLSDITSVRETTSSSSN